MSGNEIDYKELPPEVIDALYIAANGTRCPVCGGEDLVEDGYEPLDGGRVQAIAYQSCRSCRSAWTEVYDLVGVTNIKEGK